MLFFFSSDIRVYEDMLRSQSLKYRQFFMQLTTKRLLNISYHDFRELEASVVMDHI